MFTTSENQFLIWLHSVSVKYLGLCDTQRIRTLDSLISLCGSKVRQIHVLFSRSCLLLNASCRYEMTLKVDEYEFNICVHNELVVCLPCIICSKLTSPYFFEFKTVPSWLSIGCLPEQMSIL